MPSDQIEVLELQNLKAVVDEQRRFAKSVVLEDEFLTQSNKL